MNTYHNKQRNQLTIKIIGLGIDLQNRGTTNQSKDTKNKPSNEKANGCCIHNTPV